MSRITLSKSAFFDNLTLLSRKLGGPEKLAIVLKDNAYGHGLMQMAELSRDFGLTRAVVRTFAEAEAIRDLFDHILILNPQPPYIDDPRYALTINDLAQLDRLPPHTAVELKVDTGMHRNGIHREDLKRAFLLVSERSLRLRGVMTHFRSADELGATLFWQMRQWRSIKEEVTTLCKECDMPLPHFHSANSAATLRLKHYEDDFARCGIAAYGYHEMHPAFGVYPLRPVMRLYADKITTLKLQKGERIGYGGCFRADREMVVSTYDIGYGDGFLRYDGSGEMVINGRKILGKISMDSFSAEGAEEAIALIGDAKEIAHRFGTISYDILVKLNPAIPRTIVD